MDGGVVPRAPPWPAARLAVGRPRAAQGGGGALSWLRRPRGGRALRTVPEPHRPLLAALATNPMIRHATPNDLELVKDFWREFEAEVPDAEWRDDDSAHDLDELEQAIGKNIVLLAEEDGSAVGFAVAAMKGTRLGFLYLLHVRPEARGRGVARELVREAAAQLRE